jgi:hypothetical protein
VLFAGLDIQVGEVVTTASPDGRRAVENIFPDCHIAWRGIREGAEVFPNDWLEFNFVIPALIEDGNIRHALPEHPLKLVPLRQMSADQFAFLMMYAAQNQGVRAGMVSALTKEVIVAYPQNLVN